MSQPAVEAGDDLQRPTTAESATIMATAAEYQSQQQAARLALLAAVLLVFSQIDLRNPIPSWVAGLGERIYVLVSTLQELVARDANTYVRNILGIQGLDYTGDDINPLNFAGIAADGRDLESLLAGAAIHVKERLDQGMDDFRAYRSGEDYLRLIIGTEIPDAARAAESVSLTGAGARQRTGRQTPVTIGWIRMLTPPSCGRCAILAGRFYKWSDGFERHPNCDCRHIPVTVAAADGIVADPMLYFNSLTTEEQDYYFGKAVAQAIRDGADISQVVNAATKPGGMFTVGSNRYTRVGTTKAGYFGGGHGNSVTKQRRPTPWQIYHDAKGDQAKAIESLRKFGYIVGGG